jgi:hypothetical protein
MRLALSFLNKKSMSIYFTKKTIQKNRYKKIEEVHGHPNLFAQAQCRVSSICLLRFCVFPGKRGLGAQKDTRVSNF